MRSSNLPEKLSLRIMQDIATGGLGRGDHVGTQQIADRYGVSRTPVRDALATLEERGILTRMPNRGFFVSEDARSQSLSHLQTEPEDALDDYQQLASDWLTDKLPEEITEQKLRQIYGFTKAKLSDLMARAMREGWAERKDGYGWRFRPVAKTGEAFDAIYRFRIAIEPAAMLEPDFELDRRVLAEQRDIQQRMLDMDPHHVPAESFLENGAKFHEELIALSGNPFFLVSLQRVNRMRRLMEYRTEISPERIETQCREHLELLGLLEAGEIAEASYYMRRHLGSALKRKSPLAHSWHEAGRQSREPNQGEV
ncbi:GntR family transcriptional regulator [uncultured Cohaesibacter sp.]|uniref:GntR family transcriptional regulator n=1 Tax=uncultured Cohaesibacter sp. TaxID=1002546 RepID=UPI0029C83321|nr:GntR family transcriptional regulator [uncultured Cohaesibacter sp.]